MAFWGIEVKPGKPVTHSFDKVRGRLRISQATLGIGSAAKKSLVQCNVGNKRPVLLCALLPEKTESCHLDLEFEEADDVVFSVLGPRSVYLTGYYVRNSQHSAINSDTESYGEDIENTETEESVHHSDEDKYEDSFIDDDDDPVVFPPSPVSSDGADEKMLDKKNMRESKLQRKKFCVIDSDDDETSSESGDDGKFLLSVFKSKKTTKNTDSEVAEKVDRETVEISDKEADCGTMGCFLNNKTDDVVMHGKPERKNLPSNSLFCSEEVKPEKETDPEESPNDLYKEVETLQDNVVNHSNHIADDEAQRKNAKAKNMCADVLANTADMKEPDHLNITKSKRKRKEQYGEVKCFGVGHGNCMKAFNEDKALQDGDEAEAEAGAEADGSGRHLPQLNKDNQKPSINGNCNGHSSLLSPSMVNVEDGYNSKKRKKKASGKESSVRTNAEIDSNILGGDNVKQNVLGVGKMNEDLTATIGQNEKSTSDRATDFDIVADGCKSEKTKKKKKKSKTQGKDADFGTKISVISENENGKLSMQLQESNFEAMSSQVRTLSLSNGLVIEELALGEKNGKIAALGRKVKVFYTGMLKEGGRVFDSNIGRTPYKFRLGDEAIIEAWNVGLEGMRVGDKRRLIVPPSMGYGSEAVGENIPPNSWLVFYVDLVGVH